MSNVSENTKLSKFQQSIVHLSFYRDCQTVFIVILFKSFYLNQYNFLLEFFIFFLLIMLKFTLQFRSGRLITLLSVVPVPPFEKYGRRWFLHSLFLQIIFYSLDSFQCIFLLSPQKTIDSMLFRSVVSNLFSSELLFLTLKPSSVPCPHSLLLPISSKHPFNLLSLS